MDPGQLESALLSLCINVHDAISGGGKITAEIANHWLDERMALARGTAAGPVCVALRVRHRHEAGRRRDCLHVRPVLHDQADRHKHGTGPVQGVRLRAPVRRPGTHHLRARLGHEGVLLYTLSPGRAGRCGRPDRSRRGARIGQGETVVVVDDDPTGRMLVTEVLQDLGYTAL